MRNVKPSVKIETAIFSQIGLRPLMMMAFAKLVRALIAPPIAPPTTGTIKQRVVLLPQIKININGSIDNAISYHFIGEAS